MNNHFQLQASKAQNFRRKNFDLDQKLWFFSSKSLKNWPRFSNTHFWTVKKCQNFLVQMSNCVVDARKRTIYIDFIQKWRINMTHVTRVMLEKDPGIFLLVRRVNDGNMMLLAFEFGWHLWKFFCQLPYVVTHINVTGIVVNNIDVKLLQNYFAKIPHIENANVMSSLPHEYTRTRMFRIRHFGTQLHSIINFQIFPNLVIRIFICLNLTCISRLSDHLGTAAVTHNWWVIDVPWALVTYNVTVQYNYTPNSSSRCDYN